mgnify:CR=1 FL=1
MCRVWWYLVLFIVGCEEFSVRGDDVDGEHAVDCETEGAAQPADAATQCETCNACVADDAFFGEL